MGYIVEIVPKAEKEFLKLPPIEQKKNRNKILSLEKGPRPVGAKKLKETEYFRIRAGDYRVVYGIDDDRKIVKILSIAHRKDVYR